MKNKFDDEIDRSEHHERKWDPYYLKTAYHLEGNNIINSSIADLDFLAPEPIINSIKARAEQGTYSYTYILPSIYDAIVNWYDTQHNIKIKSSTVKLVHGTVNALHQLVQCLTKPGDKILIQTPVYGPFGKCIKNNHRIMIENPLEWINNRYQINITDFINKIKINKVKMFILCNPHNPGGVVWNRVELARLIKICEENNVILISDEVHSDLTLPNYHFNSLLSFPIKNNNFIVCNSPNKTFNLGGLKSSYLIILNPEIRKIVDEQYELSSITSPNVFVAPAYLSAYQDKIVKEWKKELLDYIDNNYQYFCQEVKQIPALKIMNLEASYLIWINYQNSSLSPDEVNERFYQNKLIVAAGSDFAGDSNYCFRLNIGTNIANVKKIITVLKKVFNCN